MREAILYLPLAVAENLYATFQANFRKEVLKKEKLFRGKDIDAVMREITAFVEAAAVKKLDSAYKVVSRYTYSGGKPLPLQYLEKSILPLANDEYVYLEINEIMQSRKGSFSSPEVDVEVRELGFI